MDRRPRSSGFSTIDPSWRLQFVFGGYIEHEHNHVNVGSSWNEPQITYQTLGHPRAVAARHPGRSGAADPGQHPPTTCRRVTSTSPRTKQSIFGEATFAVTSKLKITAGVRAVKLHPAVLSAVRRHRGFGPGRLYGSINGISPTVNAAGGIATPDRRPPAPAAS
ncbi:MAG: hypothetical protein WDN45_19230 [Caulobacteraceae bacterium]